MGRNQEHSVPAIGSCVRFGPFEFDLATGELWRDGEVVQLQQQPARLLALLVARAGELVSRDDIRRHLWSDSEVDAEAGVNFAIRRIRAALGEQAMSARYVETLPRRGYRFVADIEPLVCNGGARGSASAVASVRRRWWPLGAISFLLLAVAVARWELAPPPVTAACGEHPAARDAYVRGDYLLKQATGEALHRAAYYFRQAIDVDPACAPAYVGLAAASRKSLEAAELSALVARALDLAPTLPAAHLEKGWVELLSSRDFAAAGRSFDEALRLDPSLTPAYYGAALVHSILGRPEQALVWIDQALRIDPASTAVAGDAALVLYWAGEVERAVAQFDHAVALEPKSAVLRWAAMSYLIDAGRLRLAAEQAREFKRLYGRPEGGPWPSPEAEIEDFLRRSQEATLAPDDDSPPHAGRMIESYLGLGEPEKALPWLPAAVDQGWYGILYLGIDPRFDPLRHEPQFQQILRQLGLEDHRLARIRATPELAKLPAGR